MSAHVLTVTYTCAHTCSGRTDCNIHVHTDVLNDISRTSNSELARASLSARCIRLCNI